MNFRFITILFLILLFSFTTFKNSYSGGLALPNSETDTNVYQLYSFYDLRDRESFVQVTSPDTAVTVHFQVFDVSNLCTENNFFDTYTPNDTHTYNMRDILTNNGNPSGVILSDGAYGFVVVTAVLGQGQPADTDANIIGNFRVIDNSGYEYRTNSQNGTLLSDLSGNQFTFNYSSNGGINESDVIGITVNNVESGEVTASLSGVTFDTNLYNNNEVPFSCSDTTFSCTESTFEYGINDALPSSRDGDVTCGSNVIDEGFVVLDRITSNETELFAGYVGLNTGGSSRGSMDSMWTESFDELTMLSNLCSDGIDNDQNGLTDCEELGCDGVVIDSGGGPVMCESLGETSCEDGFDNDNNGLTDCEENVCMDTPFCMSCESNGFCRVFVTSTEQNGNLGGVAGADMICQNLADASMMTQGGTYRAWISDSSGNSPNTNFFRADVPYQLLDGTQVAANYSGLIQAPQMNLDNEIDIDETATSVGSFFVWTGTNGDGSSSGDNCNNWVDSTDQSDGTAGFSSVADVRWTNFQEITCETLRKLYCFEQ